MKRGLFFLLFMVAFVFKGFSQSTPADSTEMYAYIDSVLAETRGPIKRTDFFNLLTTFNSYMAVQGVNGTGLLSAGDTASMLTPYISRNDTATAFIPFIERSDTASMLASYTRYVEFLDSISDLRSDLGAGAVQPSDTASMLTPYISRSDTAAMLAPYATTKEVEGGFEIYNQTTTNDYRVVGRNYLIANANALWEFGTTPTERLVSYQKAPDSIPDLTGNNWGLINTSNARGGATINEYGETDEFVITQATSGKYDAYQTNNVAAGFMNNNAEFHIYFAHQDGDASYPFAGINQSTNRRLNFRINTSGFLEIYMDMSAGSTSIYTSSSALFSNGITDPIYLRIRLDFTNDILTVYKDGKNFPMTLTSGTGISAQSTGFNWTYRWGIGIASAAAPPSTTGINGSNAVFKIWKAAVTPLLSNENARDVAAYFTNQSSLVVGSPYYTPMDESTLRTSSVNIQLNGNAPTDNVVVTATSKKGLSSNGSPLTFTTSNWETLQSLTFTPITDNSNDGYKVDTITITAIGGGYNEKREIYIPIANTKSKLKLFQAMPHIHSRIVQEGIHPDSARAWAIDSIFSVSPFGDFPAYANVDSINNNYTGSLHKINKSGLSVPFKITKLVNSSVDRQNYNWYQRSYLIERTDQKNKRLAFVSAGHGSEQGHTDIANKLLLNGYDIVEVSMPITNKNTETNPNVNSVGVGAHNDLVSNAIDANDTMHLYLFLESIFEVLNFIDSAKPYSQYTFTGISGGGWTAMMAGALDNRFTAIGIERGISLYSANYTSTEGGDYEQGGFIDTLELDFQNSFSGELVTDFYEFTLPYLDILLLNGETERELYQRHNVFDNCCHEGSEFKLLEPWLNKYIDRYTLKFDRDTINYAHSYDSISIAGTAEAFLRGRTEPVPPSFSAGWAHYIDTAYATAADSFYVAQGSTLTLPIKADMTAALANNYLPNGVDSLFSQHDSTILGITTGASYTVRVTFKAKNSSNTGYATIAFDIGTGGTPNITTAETLVFPKGAGVETQESKTVFLYSLDTFVANGCKIKITADTGNLEIYDIRLLVRLDSRP